MTIALMSNYPWLIENVSKRMRKPHTTENLITADRWNLCLPLQGFNSRSRYLLKRKRKVSYNYDQFCNFIKYIFSVKSFRWYKLIYLPHRQHSLQLFFYLNFNRQRMLWVIFKFLANLSHSVAYNADCPVIRDILDKSFRASSHQCRQSLSFWTFYK